MKTGRRFGLLMGSSLKIDDSMPSITTAERDKNLSTMTERLANLGEYSFTWPSGKSGGPKTIANYSRARVLRVIEEAFDGQSVKTSDLFLFYYFGHGYVGPENRLALAFDNSGISGNPSSFGLEIVLQEAQRLGFKRAVLIVDCCHAGVAARSPALDVPGIDYFLMSSTGSGWVNTGPFTDALAKVLRHPRPQSLRVKGRDVITFQTWFDAAADEMPEGPLDPKPISGGGLGSEVLTSFELAVASAVRNDAPVKSVYSKLYHLLAELERHPGTHRNIRKRIEKLGLPAFQIVVYDGRNRDTSFVSEQKILEYLRTAETLSLASIGADGLWRLSARGEKAISQEGATFNRDLVSCVFRWLKPTGLTKTTLNELLYQLAQGAILPTVVNLERLIIDTEGLSLMRRKDMRTALRILAYAGVIRRAVPDTYFPR